ncbi:hypothetical protein V6N12_010593 [Hibiscus sabdariffa]|uniref:Uncharacterized protein n=1 Tax=Hibiscus sabdariffa TaxID=183260 RepID=A0ABR2EPC2_9ROSI
MIIISYASRDMAMGQHSSPALLALPLGISELGTLGHMKGHVPIIEPTSSLASVSSSCLLVAAIASDFQLGIWAGLLRIFETGNVLGQSRKWKRKAGFATIDGGGCAVIHGPALPKEKKQKRGCRNNKNGYGGGMDSTVGSKNGSTESADNCLPRLPVKRHVAEPGTSFHIGYTGPSTAPRAKPCRRLTFAHLLCLINQKTETYHDFVF